MVDIYFVIPGVQHPPNVVVGHCENALSSLAQFMEVRKGVYGLVEATRKASQQNYIIRALLLIFMFLYRLYTFHEVC